MDLVGETCTVKNPAACQLDHLLALETRHDDLLDRLEDLDKRVSRVLAEYQGARHSAPDGGQEASHVTGRGPE